MNSDSKKRPSSAFVADLHCDTVLQMRRGYDISRRHDQYHIDIPRLKEGGVGLLVLASLANPDIEGKSVFEMVNEYIDTLHTELAKNSRDITICLNSKQVLAANKAGKIAAILSIEGGTALENNPKNLEYFYNRGIRLMTMTHERSSDWCISWSDQNPAFRGIGGLGREIVEEMNRLGIIIDISHCEESSAAEIIRTSRHPVAASHSCAAAISPSGRNLSDRLITAIAEKGGISGVTFVYFLLSAEINELSSQLRKQYVEENRAISKLFVSAEPEEIFQKKMTQFASSIEVFEKPLRRIRPTVKTVVDHIDYISNLAGVDFVGIGSDFDGMSMPPLGLEDCSQMPNLTKELLNRGYKRADTIKILGGNFMRVFRQVCG
jgi:membrane dipeptidase